MMFSLLPIIVMGEISGPALNAMMSKLKGEGEQGGLQGVACDESEAYFPGAPFLASALVLALGLWVFTRMPA